MHSRVISRRRRTSEVLLVAGGASEVEARSSLIVEAEDVAAGVAEDSTIVRPTQLMQERRVSESTKRTYSDIVKHLSTWMLQNKPQLASRTNSQELDLALVTLEDLLDYLDTRVDRFGDGSAGSSISPSYFNLIRASIRFAFLSASVPLPARYEQVLSEITTGIKRTYADVRRADTRRGVTPAGDTGKTPLSFSLYRTISRAMLLSEDRDTLWGHLYSTMTWNLMCRTSNTTMLSIHQFRRHNDALAIYFTKAKNDQTGDRLKDPFHVYANPLMPEICPVLALGLMFLCFACGADGSLFPGSKQPDRFGGCVRRLFGNPDVAAHMRSDGAVASELGVHSWRKGASTYVTSGSTDGPSIMAVSARAAWKVGVVQQTYLKYERASDYFVGRIVAGLPLHDTNFSLLPPHFPPNDSDVAEVVNGEFPVALTSMQHMAGIFELCLASVVYHRDWLTRHLPPQSPLRALRIISSRDISDRLAPKLLSGTSSTVLTATGLPGHINHMAQVQELSEKLGRGLSSLAERLDSIGQSLSSMPEAVSNALDNRAVDGGEHGQPTAAAIRRVVLRDVSDEVSSQLAAFRNDLTQLLPLRPDSSHSGASASASTIAGASAVAASSTTAANDPSIPAPLRFFAWGDGKIHMLPKDYVLPRCTLRVAWKLWLLGAPPIPPLHLIVPRIDAQPDQRGRFSVWNVMFRRLDLVLHHRGITTPTRPTAQDVEHLYSSVQDFVAHALSICGQSERTEGYVIDTVEKMTRRPTTEAILALADDAAALGNHGN